MHSEKKINWAILVTGWGRSAQGLIKDYSKNKLKNSIIKLLVYELEPCGAKDIADKYGIETIQLVKNDFTNSKSYQNALIRILGDREIDYIFLIAYKHILKDDILETFKNRIINIHPSLFPSFLGTETAIQDALNYGVKISGITTHTIDEKVDRGTILCQEVIKFKENDTFETLYPKFYNKGRKIIIKTIRKVESLHF